MQIQTRLYNAEYAREKKFIKSCLSLNIKPTKRQASKFRNGKGCLFKGTTPSVPYYPEENNSNDN